MKEIRLILLSLFILSISQIQAKTGLCFRADSLFAEFKYSEALSEYINIFQNNKSCMKPGTAINAAIAAAQCDKDSLAVCFVNYALEADPAFFDERISVTELLEDCRLMPQWNALQDESERRLTIYMTNYDIPL
ncbi:MAG: hypothetical protein K2N35_02635, partial [Muribaculaceae bacterium]|nr:hypothetical protein [Muribaculaceae bacterium]